VPSRQRRRTISPNVRDQALEALSLRTAPHPPGHFCEKTSRKSQGPRSKSGRNWKTREAFARQTTQRYLWSDDSDPVHAIEICRAATVCCASLNGLRTLSAKIPASEPLPRDVVLRDVWRRMKSPPSWVPEEAPSVPDAPDITIYRQPSLDLDLVQATLPVLGMRYAGAGLTP